MSGKPWTPERKAAFSASMQARWLAGVFDKRRAATIDEAERAARSARMSALNVRARDDDELKRKMVRGQKRARRSPAYRAIQSAVMKDIMARPEQRRRAHFHALRINRNPRTKKRQWASRRRQGLQPRDAKGKYIARHELREIEGHSNA